MKGYLVESPAGLFLVEKTGKITEKVLFPRNPKDAAIVLGKVRQGLLPPEHSGFAERLAKLEIDQLTVDSQSLASIARSLGSFPVVLEENDNTIARLRNRLPGMLARLQIIESKDEYEQFIRDVSLELAKTAIAEATGKRDLYAIQTVRCIEDLDKTLNLLSVRIREWYGLHFPELDRLVEKHDTYMRLVQKLGARSNFSNEALAKLGIPQDKSFEIADSAQKSTGGDMPGPDLDWLQEVCGTVLQLHRLREAAEKYTDKIMLDVAPNTSAVLGPVLTAKMVSIAGGLEHMAKMPASTLQVLGAEKALFRTLTTGARPPKHGIIFQYGPIHQSPKWLRGKIARAVAGKIAIAARMDAFGGNNEGEKMKNSLDMKIKELKTRQQTQPRRKDGPRDRPISREDRRRLYGKPGRRQEARNTQPGPREHFVRRDDDQGPRQRV
ncbi:C/D box methylation guide ribonucleoprotein complex aNOP56 subunit [Candidatus Bathyarchaeota archaeon]|nr:MAG: C/D box methylation guide ribonucleoprotein complex aNOP56 subunit [Candidatus Bathyarchaeota archaeon]TMI31006.1 MAG: C/D box methylation guide ribonucleoprotein complex aNOP56 subunit [Candidatus Bathyarchaeota archaeon]